MSKMIQSRKDELRRRLAVAEALSTYHECMRPLARLGRWLRWWAA